MPASGLPGQSPPTAIFSSNLSTKDLEGYWRPSDVLPGGFHPGLRIVERIREYCSGVSIKGGNLRETKW